MSDDWATLDQMLAMSDRLIRSLEGVSKQAYLDDVDKFDAACMRLIVLGEGVSRLSERARSEASGVPWRKVRDLRNRLAHGYFEVDRDMLWDILTNDVPKLRNDLLSLWKRFGP